MVHPRIYRQPTRSLLGYRIGKCKGGQSDYQPDQQRLHERISPLVLDGNAILFTTERYGMRAHASWGSQNDAMLVFLNQDAFDKFRLSKEDYELQKELEKEQQKDKEKASIDPKKDKKKGSPNRY